MSKEIQKYIELGSEEWSKSNFTKSKEYLLKAWDILPEPKELESESFNLAKFLIIINLKLEDIDSALHWANQIQVCDLERGDIGERELWKGKVLYELGELEEARKILLEAEKKSLGRCFTSEDIKYQKFIKTENNHKDFKELMKIIDKEFFKSNFNKALQFIFDALNYDEALNNSFLYLRKGQCHFELRQFNQSADSLVKAFMIEGENVFKKEDSKYFKFLKKRIK